MNERLVGGIRIPVNIEDEMKQSYMDYAMSVIIGRALPDVRDGLKPVHRRILYTMHDMKNDASHPYKKSARIVGEVMGKYHPHGDQAIYDAIVRMAQDFSLRYTLVDGQGNFGSVDGDSAAAMRYTEIRMQKLAGALLKDIEKETVDFVENYDGSLTEPDVLPARLPNLLINGSSGIAVGMATNIPPHNLGEVVDATMALIDDPSLTAEDLIQYVPGPDFPTGGFICGTAGVRSGLLTGRGSAKMRAKAIIEKQPKGDREHIVVTEIPYQVNKSKLIEDIADLVRHKKIEGISDLRDESDRDGMRIVIELKRGTIPGVVLNLLYKHTQLESNFGINLLAIVNKQPRLLNLRQMISEFIGHRKVVVTRRTRFELRKAEERAHILEGLKKALDNLDAVIKLIRASKGPAEAKEGLMAKFKFSAVQAQAILDMRLQRLTALERNKIIEEYRELLKLIARLNEILASERVLMSVIKGELEEERKLYNDERRTEIIPDAGEISIEDMIAVEDMVIAVSHSGYIKRTSVSTYRKQRRGGKGVIGMKTKDQDFVEHLFIASTHSYILIFTRGGRVHWLKVHEIPEVGSSGKGKAIVNLLHLSSDELVASILPVKDLTEERHVIMATRRGIVKKTELPAFQHPRVGGIIAISVDEGDELLTVELSGGEDQVFLGTHLGKAIRFHERDIRAMGRTARGVIGIRLRPGDYIVEMAVTREFGTILSVTEHGFGKRTAIDQYRLQGRGGSGIINLKVTERNGPVVGMMRVDEDDQLIVITQKGMIIRMNLEDIKVIGRATQGVKVINTKEGDKVVAVAKLVERDPDLASANDEDEEDDLQEPLPGTE
jgi:DNA gyrase subunit A